jgi:hypothetical protein
MLAEQLSQQLDTDFCEAQIWSEDRRHDSNATIYEERDASTALYDFAVVLLAKEDVIAPKTYDEQNSRDNCISEAGIFIANIGPHRCFIASSVEQDVLPWALRDLQLLTFEEPVDLLDEAACSHAVNIVSSNIKDRAKLIESRRPELTRMLLLSFDDLYARERLFFEGGDLHEGQVVVCDIQTQTDLHTAIQAYRNITKGINYLYFLPFSEDTLKKLIQGLQILATSIADPNGETADFDERLKLIRKEQEKVLDGLRGICQTRSLVVSFLPTPPQFRFRLHNATDSTHARLYLRHRSHGYLLWEEGDGAVSLWESLPHYISIDHEERFFVPLINSQLEGAQKKQFLEGLDRALNKYFPGIQDAVRRLCLG